MRSGNGGWQGFVATTIDGKIAAGLADLERAMRIAAGYWKVRRLHGWALLADNRRGKPLPKCKQRWN